MPGALSNDEFFDGKVTLSDAIYSLSVVAGASSPPAVTDLTGRWNSTTNMVQTPDYTSADQAPVVINGYVGDTMNITIHSGNVFGGHTGPIEDASYIQGVVRGDQVFIQERHEHTVHFHIGTYTRNGDEEKIEGIVWGYEDLGTPPSCAEVGEFVAIKSTAILIPDP